MKRFISTVLAVLMLCSVFGGLSLTVSATGNANDSVKASEIPIYQANALINGLAGDEQNSLYNVLFLREPLYYDLTTYMLEDGILCWTSNFWNSAFNSDFKSNPNYFYEVMLMGFLKFDSQQMEFSGAFNSKEMDLAVKLYDEISSTYVDSVKNPTYKEFLTQLNEIPNNEYKNILKNVEYIELSQDALSTLSDGCSYASEFIEAVSEYQALLNIKKEKITLLKKAKEKVTDNEYFTKAVDDVIEKMENATIEYVGGKMMSKLWDDFLSKTWELIVENSPIGAILKSIDIEKMTLDVLFNSSDMASNNFKLLVLYIMDTYFRTAMKDAKTMYETNCNVNSAETFIECFRAYVDYQIYGLEYTKTFIKDIVDGGMIHNCIEKIFFRENIETAEELINLCDNQINSRNNLLKQIANTCEACYSVNGYGDLIDAIIKENHIVDSGQCGDNVNWKFYDDGELYIYGSGDMVDYSYPYNYRWQIKKIEIANGITSICKGAFEDCKKLTSITIPDSVTSIGNSAFADCEKLTSITIPDSVTSIGNSAFADCEKLTSITIPNSVTSICASTFYNTGYYNDSSNWIDDVLYINNHLIDAKTTISGNYDIRKGTVSISESAFYFCRNLTSITIPDSVISGTGVFEECINLTYIKIGNGVTSIDSCAFDGCGKLTSITIGDSVTSIGGYAFRYCTSLESITIPESVTRIGEWAFYNCDNLATVKIGNGVTVIDSMTFCNCTSLTSITIPDSVTSIAGDAFDNTAYCNDSSNWIDGVLYINNHLIEAKTTILGNYDVRKGTTSIGYGAFSSCKNLTSITIPHSVISIDGWTFSGCENLANITLPDSVASIGDYAFKSCHSLTSITIPDSVASIGDYAFSSCHSLTSITIPDSVTNIGKGAFDFCSSLTNVTIGNGVTSIGEDVFNLCSSLTSIIIPDSVTSIYDDNFFWCDDLTIYGYAGSYAESYAKENDIPFKKISENDKLTTVKLKKTSVTLYLTGTTKIKVTVTNGVGKTSYKSSDTKVATVNANGRVTAKKAGTAKITVTNNGVKKTFKVTVKNPKLNLTKKILSVKKSFDLKITGKVGKATFVSTNKKVATVNSKGKIMAKKKGESTIKVKTNGIILKCKVTVR